MISADQVAPGSVRWRRSVRTALEVLAFVLLVVLVWETVVRLGDFPTFLLPSFGDVAEVLVRSWRSLLRNMLVTMQSILLGFVVGSIAGFTLGILVRYVRFAYRMLHPIASMLYVIPKSVFVPLFFLWWGAGPAYKLLVIVLLVFFPVMENTVAGLKAVERDMVDLSRSLGGGRFFTFRKIELPSALPFVLAGLRLGVTEAFVGAVIVELIIPRSGIGAQIIQAGSQGNTQFIIAGIVVIAAFGILTYQLLAKAEQRLTSWY